MASVREKDRNDDIFIGIRYPLGFSPEGFFFKTKTILEQSKANMRNLLLTSKGERVMQPDFGSRLLDIVFDQGSNIPTRIEEEIREVVGVQLPYININNVFVVQLTDTNQVDVSIEFSTSLEPDALDTLTFNFNIGE
jgi:phage baseplate assembly protein W|tara:strand:+ start:816 stop:1226 length:411 start_codon:yes stop_codon:yes gene_type:complete